MAKKDLQSVTANLGALAATMPTQMSPAAPPKAKPAARVEEVVGFTFQLRVSQREELEELARKAKMTAKAFTLSALRAKGLTVTDDDLLDGRKLRTSR